MDPSFKYGIFYDGPQGPFFIEFFRELEPAKLMATSICKSEKKEVFVFSFTNYSEVARFRPADFGKPAAL